MRDTVMGLVALIGWVILMVCAISFFLIGVTAVGKVFAVVGGSMFGIAVLYANATEGDSNGRANR